MNVHTVEIFPQHLMRNLASFEVLMKSRGCEAWHCGRMITMMDVESGSSVRSSIENSND